MNFELHRQVALILGQERSCGKKVKYGSLETATKAAVSVTQKIGKELEAYPCPFCEDWHIGRRMSEEELQQVLKQC